MASDQSSRWNAAEIHVELVELSGGPSPERRDELIAVVLRHTEPLCGHLARTCCRYPGLRFERDFDDLANIARTVEFEMLQRLSAGTPHAVHWVNAWVPYLAERVRSAVRRFAQSSENTGFTGATGIARRRAAFAASGLGGTSVLDLDTAIASYNDGITASRADPGRQGAFVTRADLEMPPVAAPTDDFDAIVRFGSGEFDGVDVTDVITRTIDACNAVGERHGTVASIWFDGFRNGGEPTAAEIAPRVGVSEATVRRILREVKAIFRAQYEQ